MLRALFPKAVFLHQENSVHAPVNLFSNTTQSRVHALIDSGATESFLSPSLIEQFDIPTYPLTNPRTIRNVDGTKNSIGEVTNAADLDIQHNGITETHTFYVIDLGNNDDMLLGMPFLTATNPEINWTTKEFSGYVNASITDYTPSKISEYPIQQDNILVRRTTKATTLAAKAMNKTECSWQEQVPIEYHKFGIVFSNEAAKQFPEKRP